LSEILEFKSLGWLKGVDGSTLVGVKGVMGKTEVCSGQRNPWNVAGSASHMLGLLGK
jgi:hypothetical protein